MYRLKKLYISFLRFKKAFVNYPFKKFNFVEIVLFWIHEHLNRSQFLILSGVLVGLTAGFGGVVSKVLVHKIQYFITQEIPFKERLFIFAIFPLIGIVLTTLIFKYFFGGKEDKELGYVLKDISKNGSKIRKDKMYSQIIQSAVTIGFGGSVGLETPIAVTGSAIGSNYGQRYRLGFKERTLLLASGAAAGIASAFDAPIAGVMFSFEILLTGLVFTDFIPLVIAAVCGSLLSTVILKEEVLFHFPTREVFDYTNIFYYLILGILAGLYARYYLVVGQRVNRFFERFKKKLILRAIIGGALLSLLCVIFPPLFGEGYINIKILHQGGIYQMLENSLFHYFNPSAITVIIFLGLALFMKAFATSITLSSGGNGGNFAPSLIAGGLLGYLFGFILQTLGISGVPITNLMLVGMAGVMAGAMYAPLTGIFLIAEVSSGYDLFIPLMIVAVIAYAINRFFSNINPSYKKLADKGDIFTTRQDQNILIHISLKDCLNPRTLKVEISESLDEIIEKVRNSNQNTIAVVNDKNRFLGIISRERLRPYLLNRESTEGVEINKLMISPSFVISETDSVKEVIKMFEEADVWQLPLLDEEKQFNGFVSRSAILNNYRTLLREISDS